MYTIHYIYIYIYIYIHLCTPRLFTGGASSGGGRLVPISRSPWALLQFLYEEFARLAETVLAQTTLNYLDVVWAVLSQPSLRQPSKFLMYNSSGRPAVPLEGKQILQKASRSSGRQDWEVLKGPPQRVNFENVV